VGPIRRNVEEDGQRKLRFRLSESRVSKQPVETTLYSLSAAPPRQPDRRSQDRFLSLLRVGALLMGDRRELCLIRNISAGGMMIRPYSSVEVGTFVSVELKQGDEITGVAQWAENGLVGIAFDAPIDVVALLTASQEGPQPRKPRIEVDCTASVREDGDVHRARTLNISQGGICVHTRGELTIDAHVVISLPGLPPAPGVVKWKDADTYGIGFNRVVPVGQLMGFVQDQQKGAPLRAAS
jgi:hypothetical protein